MISSPTAPAQPLVQATASTPIPKDPAVPQAILDLASKPLFRGEYSGTEKAKVHEGLPFFGTKGTSTRGVTFSNEFNILRTSGPMVGYAASSLGDAIRSARKIAFDWSDPAFGGEIYASVGVAVLQSADNNFFTALIGSGDPETSSSELSYRLDRFDGNIKGRISKSSDAKTASAWTAPVDKNGHPVKLAPPANDREIDTGDVKDYKVEKLIPATAMLKAVVDINDVYTVGG